MTPIAAPLPQRYAALTCLFLPRPAAWFQMPALRAALSLQLRAYAGALRSDLRIRYFIDLPTMFASKIVSTGTLLDKHSFFLTANLFRRRRGRFTSERMMIEGSFFAATARHHSLRRCSKSGRFA